jgi:hypothetical protein
MLKTFFSGQNKDEKNIFYVKFIKRKYDSLRMLMKLIQNPFQETKEISSIYK